MPLNFFFYYFLPDPLPLGFKGLGSPLCTAGQVLLCVGTTQVPLGRYWWCALPAGRF